MPELTFDAAALHGTAYAARFLGKSEDTIRRMVAAGRLGCYRIGGTLKFSDADLERYLDSCRREPVA